MRHLETSVYRTIAGAGLVLYCGTLGHGVVPEPIAAPTVHQANVIDTPVVAPGVAEPGVVVASFLAPPEPADLTIGLLGSPLFGISLAAAGDIGSSWQEPMENGMQVVLAGGGWAAGTEPSSANSNFPRRPNQFGWPDLRPVIARLMGPDSHLEPAPAGATPAPSNTDSIGDPPALVRADFPVSPADVTGTPLVSSPDPVGHTDVAEPASDPLRKFSGRATAAANQYDLPTAPLVGGAPGTDGSAGLAPAPEVTPDDPFQPLFDGSDPLPDYIAGGGQQPFGWGQPLITPAGDTAAFVPVVALAVKEPASLALMGLALLCLGLVTRSRSSRARDQQQPPAEH